VTLLLVSQIAAFADDTVFSGPQVGEELPPFKVKGVFDDQVGKEIDLIESAKGKPIAMIFVHLRTRPAFGLTNTIMRYAASKAKEDLHCGVIFLTNDPTSAEKWMNTVKKHLPKGVEYGISTDGPEGPGAYGLNRNVALTVLVGKQNKVTANFAIVQPSLQADGPKILKAIIDVTGGGKVPTIAELSGRRFAGDARMKRRPDGNDPKLRSLLRAVIDKQASAEDVEKRVLAIEKYVEKNEKAKRILGQIATRVVHSRRFTDYGTKPAQKALRHWEEEYGNPRKQGKNPGTKVGS